jgi:hypothetical protein
MHQNEFTLLVTGPVSLEWERLNYLVSLAIESNIEVVIATWESCAAELDLFRNKHPEIKVCLCAEITSTPGYYTPRESKEINFDRQWYLMNSAKHLCNRGYIIRVRSDISINLEILMQFKNKMDAGLILTTDVSSVNPELPLSSKLLMHPCDWLFACSRPIFMSFIDDARFYFKLLQSDNYTLSNPYKVEDRTYVSLAAAEQLFGASMLRIKSTRNFFTEKVLPFKAISTVGGGFYVVESRSLGLQSEKQRLRFLYPFRLREDDNYAFKKVRWKLGFLIEIFVHFLRIVIRKN